MPHQLKNARSGGNLLDHFKQLNSDRSPHSSIPVLGQLGSGRGATVGMAMQPMQARLKSSIWDKSFPIQKGTFGVCASPICFCPYYSIHLDLRVYIWCARLFGFVNAAAMACNFADARTAVAYVLILGLCVPCEPQYSSQLSSFGCFC